MKRSIILLLLLAVCLPAAAQKKKKGSAADAFRKGNFPEITAEQWALEEVPFEPSAPAVVLDQTATITMAGARQGQQSTSMVVTTRVKILNEAGLDYAEYTIQHDEDERLTNVSARTVLPGGEVIVVDDDSIFRRSSELNVGSRESANLYETAIAFPKVVPGAILDYSFEVRYDWILTSPWFFQTWIPTMHSEINYLVPNIYAVRPLARVTVQRQVEHDMENRGQGRLVRVWMDEIPSVAKEPMSFPRADLASNFNLLFTAAGRDKIFDDWSSTCSLYNDEIYREHLRKDKKTKAKALAVVGEIVDPIEKAKAIYAYVRDEIEDGGGGGVWLDEPLDDSLEAGEASYAGKAALLMTMLEAAGVPAQLVWARSRFAGMFNEKATGPNQFTQAVVAATIPGGVVYLDPSDRDLPFGRLHYRLDGTQAVIFDRKNPEVVTLPTLPYDESRRHAQIDLEIDEEGRAVGSGMIEYSGHHAWRRIDWKGDDEETRTAWMEWLQDSFSDYDISELQIDEAEDKRTVNIAWKLSQKEDAVLGDEVTISPSAPFGPQDQPFTLIPSRRKTPVLLNFADSDVLELTVRYPEEWEVDVLPSYREETNDIGQAVSSIEVDEDGRTLRYLRTFDIKERELIGARKYNYARKLFAAVEKQDAQRLVLVLP